MERNGGYARLYRLHQTGGESGDPQAMIDLTDREGILEGPPPLEPARPSHPATRSSPTCTGATTSMSTTSGARSAPAAASPRAPCPDLVDDHER